LEISKWVEIYKRRIERWAINFSYRIEKESYSFHKIKKSDSTKQFRNNNTIQYFSITSSYISIEN
jgi:hypothetical protein